MHGGQTTKAKNQKQRFTRESPVLGQTHDLTQKPHDTMPCNVLITSFCADYVCVESWNIIIPPPVISHNTESAKMQLSIHAEKSQHSMSSFKYDDVEIFSKQNETRDNQDQIPINKKWEQASSHTCLDQTETKHRKSETSIITHTHA